MPQTGIRDLKTHLSSYLRKVEAGQTVIITRRGKPIDDAVRFFAHKFIGLRRRQL